MIRRFNLVSQFTVLIVVGLHVLQYAHGFGGVTHLRASASANTGAVLEALRLQSKVIRRELQQYDSGERSLSADDRRHVASLRRELASLEEELGRQDGGNNGDASEQGDSGQVAPDTGQDDDSDDQEGEQDDSGQGDGGPQQEDPTAGAPQRRGYTLAQEEPEQDQNTDTVQIGGSNYNADPLGRPMMGSVLGSEAVTNRAENEEDVVWPSEHHAPPATTTTTTTTTAESQDSAFDALEASERDLEQAAGSSRNNAQSRGVVQSDDARQNVESDDSENADEATNSNPAPQAQPPRTRHIAEDSENPHTHHYYRPSANTAKADVVRFGIYAKSFYGADLTDHTFTMDSVLTLKWNDVRSAGLVREGGGFTTLSDNEASANLWMPDVVITNIEIQKLQPISTSVTVAHGGEITKVERNLAVMKNTYDITAFPFDIQVLSTRIASAKYMIDEVVLEPMNDSDVSGVRDDIFKSSGFTLVSSKITTFDDIDGKLQKSRGVLEVTVKRQLASYVQGHLVPSGLLLMLSYSVFWFPFQSAFITSRLALSIITLLVFTVLSMKVSRMLPLGAPYTWHDLFSQNCQWLMFFTVSLNIYTEIVFHQCKCEELGTSMNHEVKILWPILVLLAFGGVFWDTSGLWLPTQALVTTFVLVCTVFVYSCWSCTRLSVHMEENEMEDAAWAEHGDESSMPKQ